MYASTSNDVYRWPYNAAEGTLGANETLVTNMSNSDVSTIIFMIPVDKQSMWVGESLGELPGVLRQRLNDALLRDEYFLHLNPLVLLIPP